jgi:hypothetical protein
LLRDLQVLIILWLLAVEVVDSLEVEVVLVDLEQTLVIQ